MFMYFRGTWWDGLEVYNLCVPIVWMELLRKRSTGESSMKLYVYFMATAPLLLHAFFPLPHVCFNFRSSWARCKTPCIQKSVVTMKSAISRCVEACLCTGRMLRRSNGKGREVAETCSKTACSACNDREGPQMSGPHKPLLSRQPSRTNPKPCRTDPSSPIVSV